MDRSADIGFHVTCDRPAHTVPGFELHEITADCIWPVAATHAQLHDHRQLLRAARLATAGPLIIAADGSAGANGGSAACIRSDGVYRVKFLPTSNIVVCELAAIRKALKIAPELTAATITTDSTRAIDAINGIGAYAHSAAAQRVREWMRIRRNASVIWQRGHDGAGLNDGADRLAKLIRRCDGILNVDLAERIVAEATAAHALQPVSRTSAVTADLAMVV